MARIKIDMPDQYLFSTILPIQITDINYGNHLANDKLLSMMHEARIRFFNHFDCSELDLKGVSVIMGDVAIEFKSEGFYGQSLKIEVTAAEFGSKSFDIFYKFTNQDTGKILAHAKTGIVCFNYDTRQTKQVPESFRKIFL